MILNSVVVWSERETVHRGGGGVCGQALREHLTCHPLHVVQEHPNGSAVTCHQPYTQGSKLKISEVCFSEKAAFQSKQPQLWEGLPSSPPVSGHKQATNSQTWPLSDLKSLASGSFTPPSWFLGRGRRRVTGGSSSRAVLTLSHKSCPARKSWF